MTAPIVEIGDEDALLRRIANRPNLVKRDVRRPTSAAFQPAGADGGTSVDVRRLLPDPSQPESTLDGYPGYGLVEVRASIPRAQRLEVAHAPIPGNDAHANIFPPEGMSRAAQKRAYRELALKCAWVREPAEVLDEA